METFNEKIVLSIMSNEGLIAKLDEAFGSYKAEWLGGKIFDYFAPPFYFNALKDRFPCVLQGGRGTGKTTVLRGLSYQGQFAIKNKNIEQFNENHFIGIYFRVNTNHVRAFEGRGVDDSIWSKYFSHYFNLSICLEISYFLRWHASLCKEDDFLTARACKQIKKEFCIANEINSFNELSEALEDALSDFQREINTVVCNAPSHISTLGDPIKLLCDNVLTLKQYKGKIFYLLIDEYENLNDIQQQLINTLLKHVPDSFVIKIGVRELGWRVKYTLNKHELLNDPADYALINISERFTNKEGESQFVSFAKSVCQRRIDLVLGDNSPSYKIEEALPSLTIEEESEYLKVTNSKYYEEVKAYEDSHGEVLNIPSLFKFFIAYWSDIHKEDLGRNIQDYKENPSRWTQNYENYKYGLLFKIRRGRGTAGIQKYYAGWSTFIKLSNGNIRYLMELVYRSFVLVMQKDGDILQPIPYDIQTEAARSVGGKNLVELEGAWKNGFQISKLVQSLGTVFSKIAKYGDTTAPEQVQFDIIGEMSDRAKEIIDVSVMHLALIRMSANKLSGNAIKSYQYSLHPIFAPYFLFSYRRKRKFSLKASDIIGCIDDPSNTVNAILRKRRIDFEDEGESTYQLTLFDL